MGDARWVWQWVMPHRLSSVATSDGTGFSFLISASPSGPIYEIWDTDTSGPLFFVSMIAVPETGPAYATIAVTDGTSMPQPYLEPPADCWQGTPAFAHSHIAWTRGVGVKDINLFDHVELWASPYAADPKQLKPEKIGDIAGSNMPGHRYAGGYGLFAAAESDGNGWLKEVIWDLAAKARREIPYPPGRVLLGTAGITKTHSWEVVDETGQNTKRKLVRFSVR